MKEIKVRLEEDFHREVKLEATRRGLSLQKFTKAALALVVVRPTLIPEKGKP